MKKNIPFRITLTNTENTFKFFCIVWAEDEDTAMDIALRKYKNQELQVFDAVRA